MEKTKNLLLNSLFTAFIVFTAGLLATQVAFAQSAGTVTFATGDASIVRADKSVVKAAKNDAVNAGDTIETKTGRLQLSLIDGGKVSLQPNTVYKINKYEFSGKEDGSEYAFTELVKGGLRTISGLIGHKNRDRYQLKTAVATIGIRGTEFTVNYIDNQFLMTTNHGSVDVCNASGCLNAVTGQSIAVAGVGAAPKPSSKAAKAAAAAPASNRAVFTAGEDSKEVQTVLAAAPVVAAAPTLANYDGGGNAISLIKVDSNLIVEGSVLNANIVTAGNSAPTNITTAFATNIIEPASFSQINSDGIIGWGRYNGGTVTTGGGGNNGGGNGGGVPLGISESIEWADYIIGTTPNPAQLATLTGSYNVFGSTAPMLVNGNSSTIHGVENAVVGNFNFNFATTKFDYGLTVVTNADTFILGGGGNLTAGNPAFYGSTFQGIVTSLGAGSACDGEYCAGALAGNNIIQGSFFVPKGERIGLQYGFSAPGGLIYGTAVLKGAGPSQGSVDF